VGGLTISSFSDNEKEESPNNRVYFRKKKGSRSSGDGEWRVCTPISRNGEEPRGRFAAQVSVSNLSRSDFSMSDIQ
jgi:hypothetical protein